MKTTDSLSLSDFSALSDLADFSDFSDFSDFNDQPSSSIIRGRFGL